MTQFHKIQIQDLSAPELEVYVGLKEVQLLHYFEPERGIFIAESPLVIERALDAGYEPLSMLMENGHETGPAARLVERCPQVPVYMADGDVLKGITGFSLTRGVLCAMRRKCQPKPEEICRGATRIAVLENVVNPTNVGAIFRSAAALGMDAVLLTPECSDPLYRRSLRVSMGTVFQIPWTYCEKTTGENRIKTLKEMGFCTVAMALTKNSIGIDDEELKSQKRLAVVLGTEGEGLHPDTVCACDYVCRIPMAHGVDSLNVAAASAVVFWELRG